MSFIKYLKDTQAELKHVSWPTQKQTIIFTALVIFISAIIAVFLGASDVVFGRILDYIVNR